MEVTIAIILPHGVSFRGGAEEQIRTKLLKDGHIETIVGLPANLFFSTLFIIAAEHCENGKRQNVLREGDDGEPNDNKKIVKTYQLRKEEEQYSPRVSLEEIEKNEWNLNISRYVSTTRAEEIIDLEEVNERLVDTNRRANEVREKHNKFLRELGLKEI